jgi:hypothetical protein
MRVADGARTAQRSNWNGTGSTRVFVRSVVGELIELLRATHERVARPSEVPRHRVAETLQLGDPGPMDPRRAD